MTGLPGLPTPPGALPDPGAVADVARAWRNGCDQLARADELVSTRGIATGWVGPAADAASSAAARATHDLAGTVLDSRHAISALESWAGRLRALHEERSALLVAIDEAAAELAQFAPIPDTTLASPVLRQRAWQRHCDLGSALAAWQEDVHAAEATVVDALTAPAPLAALAADTDPAHAAAAASARRALAEAAAAGIPAYLLSWEPDAFGGDGAVVIAFGDPVVAEHTAVVVPGITNDAATVDLQALGALSLEAAAALRARRTTTIAWMGYDAPSHPALHGGALAPGELRDLARTVGDKAAEDGGHELVDFVDDLREDNRDTDVTVVGHSYGSTTAAHAAVDGLDADRLVLIGSPGASDEVDRASDLGLPDGAVYVGAADNDPVTWLGTPHVIDVRLAEMVPGLGQDPAQASFGATRIAGDDGPRFHLDSLGQVVVTHNSYLAPGSRFAENVGAVVAGATPDTVPGRTVSGDTLLARWAASEVTHETSRWWPLRD